MHGPEKEFPAMGESPASGIFKMFNAPIATLAAAVISGVCAVAAALLPWLLSSDGTKPEPTGPTHAQITPIMPSADSLVLRAPERPKINLTYGVWTIVNSIDDQGTDWSKSILKFTSQNETPHGLELEGFFEWRNDITVVGREYFIAHFEEASRQLYIEGQRTESPENRLAVGSFSARLSEDGRQLLEGTWGDTPGNLSGVPGTWEARR
jgi:hypothetical protein